jgi:prepilin-type N-terminal cleavage/methylation domain-containing protein
VNRRAGQGGVTLIEMMIVMAIIALMAGLTLPAVTAGIDAIRLRSAADATSGFLNQAMARCERRQQAVEIAVKRNTGRLAQISVDGTYSRELELPDGVVVLNVYPAPLENPENRSILLYPGGSFPRIGIEIGNRRGARRLIRIDPVVGLPVVESPSNPQEQDSGAFQQVR